MNYRYLDKIQTPADLRKLPVEALPDVCRELRDFIVHAYYFYALFRIIMTNNTRHLFKKVRYELLSIPGYLRKSGNKKVFYLARSIHIRRAFKGVWSTMDDSGLLYAT